MSNSDGPGGAWRDPSQPVEARVEALLDAMTLAEKVAQLGSRWTQANLAHHDTDEVDTSLNVAPMQDVFTAGESMTLKEASRHGLGHLTRIYGSIPVTAADGAAELVRQQHTVLENDRFGIPALVHEECLTGLTSHGATVYPTSLAWGATFDPDLVERMAHADRARHGRARRAPGLVAGARRGARLPLGPRRGDDRRGSVPGVDDRRCLRARTAELRSHRHAQALRRLLGLARGPQPRAGVDGTPRTRST